MVRFPAPDDENGPRPAKAAHAGQNAPGTVEAVRAAIVDIDRAHNVSTAAVNAADDLTVAMAAASELAAHMQKLTDADAELRKQVVSRMWDADKLSLAASRIRSACRTDAGLRCRPRTLSRVVSRRTRPDAIRHRGVNDARQPP